MRWAAEDRERALGDLFAAFAAAPWPRLPAGFEPLTPPRSMRAVLRGRLPGAAAGPGVVVKRSRPVTAGDRVRRRLLGGRGVREGTLLRALAAAGVRVPRPLGWTDEGDDLLVLEEVTGLVAPPDPAHPPRAAVAAGAALLARAHAAGLVHRDLTRENLAWTASGPLLLDLGGARLARSLGARALRTELARARNGLLGDAPRTARRRALRLYLAAAGHPEAGTAGERDLARAVERRAADLARRYRLGRDRRADRPGGHFEPFEGEGGVRGVLARDHADPALRRRLLEALPALLRGAPEGARSLHAGGRVVRVDLPGAARPVVVKRFGPVAPGRRPRPLRALRAALALENRLVPTPAPLLAAAGPGRDGVLVTAWVEGEDLRRRCAGGTAADPDLLRAVGRTLRRLHDAGLVHRDLKAPNLLVERGPAGPRVLLADLEGVAVRRREPGWRRRARDLGRLDASWDLPAAARATWLGAYLDAGPRLPVTFDSFERRVAARASRKRRAKGGVG